VADIELLDFGDGRHWTDVGDGQAMPCVDGEPNFGTNSGGGPKRFDRPRVGAVVSVFAGVKLDGRRAELTRSLDRRQVGPDEKARSDAGSGKSRQALGETGVTARNVEPAFGGDLLSALRDEGYLVGTKPLGDCEHIVCAGHFKVEHGTNVPCQSLDVIVLNVPAVLAEMCGDPVGACALAQHGGGNRVWLPSAPRLSDGGYVVDVDVEPLIPKASRGEFTAGRRSRVWHGDCPSHVQTHTGVEIQPVKKLSIALVLVAACYSAGAKPTPAVRPAGAPFGNASGGATSARAAVAAFLSAARNEDLQAMALVWGTAAGPARNTIPRDELEKRELIMMCFLRHDRYQLISDAESTGGQRRIEVELEQGMLIRKSAFMVVPAPDGRWYVQSFDVEALRDFCAKK